MRVKKRAPAKSDNEVKMPSFLLKHNQKNALLAQDDPEQHQRGEETTRSSKASRGNRHSLHTFQAPNPEKKLRKCGSEVFNSSSRTIPSKHNTLIKKPAKRNSTPRTTMLNVHASMAFLRVSTTWYVRRGVGGRCSVVVFAARDEKNAFLTLCTPKSYNRVWSVFWRSSRCCHIFAGQA